METITQFLSEIKNGNYLFLARALTLIENELPGSSALLENIDINQNTPVIGITGPPGAGKSTIVNALIEQLTNRNKKVAVIAIDPTSPFNLGSLLGDRIRMSGHFNKPDVYIRSVATRGSVGGLSAKIIEMTDLIKSASFDYVIVETVGVGQSEIEIAGLADLTLVVLVPEAGDEIQHIKSGLMEIGDAFVVNKADRDGADSFANKLKKMLHQRPVNIPVFKTVADKQKGITELIDWIGNARAGENKKKFFLYTEKAFKLIQTNRMKDISKSSLQDALSHEYLKDDFNIYRFIAGYDSK